MITHDGQVFYNIQTVVKVTKQGTWEVKGSGIVTLVHMREVTQHKKIPATENPKIIRWIFLFPANTYFSVLNVVKI